VGANAAPRVAGSLYLYLTPFDLLRHKFIENSSTRTGADSRYGDSYKVACSSLKFPDFRRFRQIILSIMLAEDFFFVDFVVR